jgi:hypothetical protein
MMAGKILVTIVDVIAEVMFMTPNKVKMEASPPAIEALKSQMRSTAFRTPNLDTIFS